MQSLRRVSLRKNTNLSNSQRFISVPAVKSILIALSPVSAQGAMNNLKTEMPDWNFEKVKNAGQNSWNKELGKIAVTASVNFYTAMYHAFISPTVYMDADRQYKGLDQNIYTAKTLRITRPFRCGTLTARCIRFSILFSPAETAK